MRCLVAPRLLIAKVQGWIEDRFGDRDFHRVVHVPELHDVPDQLVAKTIYVAGTPAFPKWALFMCPCRRPHRITRSLQSSHPDRWRISDGRPGPTIFPSVDVRDWRRCHFWVKKGKVRRIAAWQEREWAGTNGERPA